MSTALHIRHGAEYWTADEAGRITRPGLVTGSDSWRIVGAVARNNFGHVVARYTLADLLRGNIAWTHANGKQRVFALDYDHGTIREWRNSHAVWPAAKAKS